jgi:hypothetical protein
MNAMNRLLGLGLLGLSCTVLVVDAEARGRRPADDGAPSASQEMNQVDTSATTDADADGITPGSGNASNMDGSRDTSTGRANNDPAGSVNKADPTTTTTP